MSLVVQLADIQLNNAWTDPYGSIYYVQKLDGWESTSLRQRSIELPSDHGEVTVSSLRSGRSISLGGLCKATSESNFYASMYYMQAQWEAVGAAVPLIVTEDRARRCLVRRISPIRTRYAGLRAFIFDLNLKADDPTKYDEAASGPTVLPATITNVGTGVTYPTITLTASGTPTIACGGFTWSATESLPSGTVIDMKARTVIQGSTSHFGKVDLTSDWFWLAPGANTVASSVAATITWRNGWQ